ncbi:metal ABC transporter permease [Nocardia cyriacigeorgica]|uniref:metal ABC transporter permease n=1 Tax=Nocardia cyriacigeorgica TaxID=135487 RepID=UPI003CC7D236
MCAVQSCWLVLIGWSLKGDAVSHAVLPGVVQANIVGATAGVGSRRGGWWGGGRRRPPPPPPHGRVAATG